MFRRYDIINNPHDRISVTHAIVVFVLSINIFFFTDNSIAITLQAILIVAVIIHHKDDVAIRNELVDSQHYLQEDKDIFDRNIIISESDLHGNITYVNKKFCEITGFSANELIGKSHNILRAPDVPEQFYMELWKTIKDGNTFHAEFKNLKHDGTPFWVDASISPIKNKGKTVGYKAIRFDITDQVVAKEGLKALVGEQELALQKQSERFEFAINSSRDGFWDYDVEAKEFYLSSGWKKRLGFAEDEQITYLDYLSLIPDESRFDQHHALHNAIEREDDSIHSVHFRIRYPLITKNGEKLMIEDVGDAFFNGGEHPIRLTGFHRDITEQERQNKMIEAQNRMAAMGEMIGNIAHQWRQPIGAINNVLNDVEFDIELDELEQIPSEQFLKSSKQIKEYTQYLSQTIDDFRNISSDDKTKIDFYLHDVISAAHAIIKSSYSDHNIAFNTIETGNNEPIKHFGYARELQQVLINILNNAKDILVEKKIEKAHVSLKLNEAQNESRICIEDNAGGVPESIIEKIFDPYFTTKHESVGTGIGLYMSKKIITENFDGKLEVENTQQGAKFTITIPNELRFT